MSEKHIPYGKHIIEKDDIDAVVEVLEHHFLTQGSHVPKFEKALCDYTGAKNAVAVNSATSALHIACLSLGVTSHDIVWTVPNSFVASANCALYCDAKIDFVDIDPNSRNISVSLLQQKLTYAQTLGKLPKVLIVVHFAGYSCAMREVHSLAKHYGFSIIEDAAHALGGSYEAQKVGCCEYSDATVLSFHPVKSMTTAEGGALLCNCSVIYENALLYAKHGITKSKSKFEGDDEGPWYYEQVTLGYNYRMSDLHAALGLSQIKKLDRFIAQRRQLALNYFQTLNKLPLILPCVESLESSAWHLFMVELTQHDRTQVFEQLTQANIGVNVHYIPIHYHPFYKNMGFKQGDFVNAEKYYANAITLPLFPEMTQQQQARVIAVLTEVLV